MAYQQRGNAQAQQGEYDKAIDDYDDALRINPNRASVYFNRGLTRRLQGDLDRAIADYTEAIRLDPKDATHYSNRGDAYAGKGDVDQAMADFNRAIALNPQDGYVCNSLAWFLATCPDPQIRDADRAVELAKKAVELLPEQSGVWNTLGVAHYRAEDWKTAMDALGKSLELRGDNGCDLLFLAMAHRQLDQKDEARQWYDKAVQWMEKNQPQDEELQRFRAEAAELLGVKNKQPE